MLYNIPSVYNFIWKVHLVSYILNRSGRVKCEVIFLIRLVVRFGLVNTIKTYLIEFVIPNLSLNYFCISETFKTNV